MRSSSVLRMVTVWTFVLHFEVAAPGVGIEGGERFRELPGGGA